MKKIFIILLSLIISAPAFSQITISKEQLQNLPDDVITVLETTARVDSVAKSVSQESSWGREIGVAVDSALDAVEEHVINLAESELGHTVTFLVCWRFLFKDVIGFIVGLIILGILIWVIKKMLEIHNSEKFEDFDDDAQVAIIVCGWLSAVVLLITAMCCIF